MKEVTFYRHGNPSVPKKFDCNTQVNVYVAPITHASYNQGGLKFSLYFWDSNIEEHTVRWVPKHFINAKKSGEKVQETEKGQRIVSSEGTDGVESFKSRIEKIQYPEYTDIDIIKDNVPVYHFVDNDKDYYPSAASRANQPKNTFNKDAPVYYYAYKDGNDIVIIYYLYYDHQPAKFRIGEHATDIEEVHVRIVDANQPTGTRSCQSKTTRDTSLRL